MVFGRYECKGSNAKSEGDKRIPTGIPRYLCMDYGEVLNNIKYGGARLRSRYGPSLSGTLKIELGQRASSAESLALPLPVENLDGTR